MGEFTVGEVVMVVFPFSNLKGQKLRPALVLANVEFGNLILCQITSKQYSSKISIPLKTKDYDRGGLPIDSYVRPDKLFTAEPSIIRNGVGKVNASTINVILKKIRTLFTLK